jgi:hypothetical protein
VIVPLPPWPISGFHCAPADAVVDTLATSLPIRRDNHVVKKTN